ncbi:WD-repeat protein-like protein [Tothia fuscella]|uniref:WD-repeat protein-like protein n=1 Tax=Tothia fuscella TaxID=1048955 RepID=A0A9P4NKK9_9PEZI|nr:WD-repeat protein-like protein [Tothia fuscella]
MSTTTVVAPEAVEGPVVKRQKLVVVEKSNGAPPPKKKRSKIFAPYRTVGLISPTNVPFTSIPLGKTTFQITTSVGRSLQTYDLRRGLNLVFFTQPQTPEVITATKAWKGNVLAAWSGKEPGTESGIWVFKRGKKVDELEVPKGGLEEVTRLLTFGSWIVGSGQTRVEIWNSTTLEHYTTIYAGYGRSGVTITGGMCNMPTYLNKILVGTSDGCVEIWNVSTGKMKYTVFPDASDFGAVTALEPTPALSLFAIAYETGPVVIHNVKTDKQLLMLNSSTGRKVAITTITFRTDGLGAGEDGRKAGVMATASNTNGDVTFWDLNDNGRKMGVLRGAHSAPFSAEKHISGGISKIEFLPGQAIIITSGMDNSLKSWIVDEVPFSPIPRILHQRNGHSAPIQSLQFLPANSDGSEADGKWLVSASHDRSFRAWSLRKDGQSSELSQGNVRKKAKTMGLLNTGFVDGGPTMEDLKAPRITCIACSLNRDGGMGAAPGSKEIWSTGGKGKGASTADSSATGWESVLTGHDGDKFARTWFWGRKKAGRWKFETGDATEVKSVAMSACGTFGLIGSAAGGIDMFNLQSGIHRQRFPARLTKKQADRLRAQQAEATLIPADLSTKSTFSKGLGKHTKAVTGLQVDNLNQTLISCSLDGKVKFWDFHTGLLLHELDWSLTSITGMHFHRPSDLIALSCGDAVIRLVDISTKKLVRQLWGCKGTITDFTFSNDGRWIVAASSDSIVRVWDLTTGHLIEALRFRSPITSIAFSPTGEYFATSHEDSVGVHVWTNRTLLTHVPTRHIADDEILDMDAPTASGEGGEAILEGVFEEEDSAEEDTDLAAPSIEQLSKELLTLSLVPKARWQTLLHLDLIRERNKPKEAPKAPEKAPFFLPSLEGSAKNSGDPFALPTTEDQTALDTSTSKSRLSRITDPSTAHTTTFTTLLKRTSLNPSDPSALLSHLSTLPPSSADLALRTLDPSPPYTEHVTFIHALTTRLEQKMDFELCQTWMAVYLKCHGGVVRESAEVRQALERWEGISKGEVGRLGDLVGFCRGVGSWIGGVV